ncbi:component of oligomeric golgi complex 3 [Volvox carteri f. nagariensis]|uniref:Conserved oligomeric Golgi complex subunit 3 n=1 Tax=Volvox carteri f. nagariensis TaxID=3068 RepID=D8TV10_VOLCA|nr:component of oligomeric golgi complex 3 [Volvox carteri f. nagariensis]EFJ48495.1 component of oligomeric golgi complex 3 [Volvox carteri f. nagariensis]|eukprot:XP_002950294.1 component of oligomeric golgi complex 3 [Volvox carteri f. nagariensis]
MSTAGGVKGLSKTLGGVASKSYNVAAIWEKTAALSESQLRTVEALGQLCTQRPLPSHVIDEQRSTAETPESHSKDAYVGTLEDAVLHNTSQFHKWHSELEAACASETEEKYKRYADLLSSHVASCEHILGKVDATLEAFEVLQVQHREVVSRSRSLHASCEQLVRQKEALMELAEAIRAKLRFFDEFEHVYAQFAAAQMSLDADQFMALLRKLDDCMAYVANNPQYADAQQYSAKFRQLQGRALTAVRGKVQQVLRAAVQHVQTAVQQAATAAAGAGAGGAAAAGGPPGSSSANGTHGNGSSAANGSSLVSQGSNGQVVPLLAEGAEVPMLYVRFRAAAEPNLKGLLREVESRAGRPEYMRLLAECHNLYAQARLALIGPYVRQRIMQYAALALPLFTRNGCEHLGRVCQLEVQLFEHFFPAQQQAQDAQSHTKGAAALAAATAKSGVAAGVAGPGAAPPPPPPVLPSSADALSPLLEPLATMLYDQLRPAVVNMQDLDELCELVDILKHEVLGEQLARRGVGGEALKPLLSRSLADVQGRLIFRVQAYIRDEISGYVLTQEDTDYPAKLERQAAAAANGALPLPASTSASADGGNVAEDNGSGSGGSAAAPAVVDPYATLFPPLRATLLVLSKLYRAVDSKIFGGLAQEAVSACTVAVQQASRAVARRAVPPAPSAGGAAAAAAATSSATTPMDAQLFMIRNLLFLREQIVPFDVDFAVTDIDLDFSHMRDHLRRIMLGQESLFTLGSSNAMVRMLGPSGPRVLTYQLDSKKELEKALKAVCEALIMALTKVAVEPMLSFITKVTAVRLAAGGQSAASTTAAGAQATKPLREQAFASPAKLVEMVGRVNAALSGPLPAAVSKMRLYLPNPATHGILLKPVKSNIAEAHGQIAKLLQMEYSPEEAAQVPLHDPQQLAAVLDSL